jgi:hypothetical protein
MYAPRCLLSRDLTVCVVDPESDLAIATMAQLLLQEGRPQEALEFFDKSVDLGRTEQELISAISYAEVRPQNIHSILESSELTVTRRLELNLTLPQNTPISPRNYRACLPQQQHSKSVDSPPHLSSILACKRHDHCRKRLKIRHTEISTQICSCFRLHLSYFVLSFSQFGAVNLAAIIFF